jgi:hypothetical protein
VGVGIARGVEPVAGHVLAVALGFEQAVTTFHKRPAGVGEEGVDLVHRGRQAGEIERDAADEGFLGGLRGGREPVLFQAGLDEGVHRISNAEFGMPNFRHGRFDGGFEAPMLLVRGAFADPALEEFDLRG